MSKSHHLDIILASDHGQMEEENDVYAPHEIQHGPEQVARLPSAMSPGRVLARTVQRGISLFEKDKSCLILCKCERWNKSKLLE